MLQVAYLIFSIQSHDFKTRFAKNKKKKNKIKQGLQT